jgi:hypothetical protein
MKKMYLLFVVMLAFVVAVPAISFGAAMQTRWDLTIGGYTKFEVGWASQGVGSDWYYANRNGGTADNTKDKYGNYFMQVGSSNFNFQGKAPDAFGAKVSTYMEIGLTSETGSGNASNDAVNQPNQNATMDYGVLSLRRLYVDFAWAQDSLRLGYDWADEHFTNVGFWTVGDNMMSPYKAVRMPQINWTHKYGDKWLTKLALNFTGYWAGVNGNNMEVDAFTRSLYPGPSLTIEYRNPACGLINGKPFTFHVSNVVGFEKRQYYTNLTPAASLAAALNASPAAHLGTSNINSYSGTAGVYVPVIPEKDPTNRQGALAFMGGITWGMNCNLYDGPSCQASYNRFGGLDDRNMGAAGVSAIGNDWTSYTEYGYWAGIEYYLTHQLSVVAGNSLWKAANLSSRYMLMNPSVMQYDNTWALEFKYIVNPSMTIGVAYFNEYTKFGHPTLADGVTTQADGKPMVNKNYGTLQDIRAAMFYYF